MSHAPRSPQVRLPQGNRVSAAGETTRKQFSRWSGNSGQQAVNHGTMYRIMLLTSTTNTLQSAFNHQQTNSDPMTVSLTAFGETPNGQCGHPARQTAQTLVDPSAPRDAWVINGALPDGLL